MLFPRFNIWVMGLMQSLETTIPTSLLPLALRKFALRLHRCCLMLILALWFYPSKTN